MLEVQFVTRQLVEIIENILGLDALSKTGPILNSSIETRIKLFDMSDSHLLSNALLWEADAQPIQDEDN